MAGWGSRIGWILFLVAAGLLATIIVLGILTSQSSLRPWEEFATHRQLRTQTAPGIEAELLVTDLKENPRLRVSMEGVIDRQTPMEFWLVNRYRQARPVRIEDDISVDRRGRVEEDVNLPDDGLLLYTTFVIRQGERIVLRAQLG